MALKEEFEKQGNVLFVYRSYIPLLILFAGIAVFATKKALYNNAGLLGLCESQNEILGLIIGLFGLLIRMYTVGYTPQNTSGRNTSEGQVAEFLNSTGIYSTVRHPLYLGNFFMYLGIAVITLNIYFVVGFILLFWLYYERIMYAEEQFLLGQFGNSYQEWSDKTPAFIPSFKNWKKPELSFSWKKVAKKEKNGLFGLFVVFFVFRLIGNYIETGGFIVDRDWLTYATVTSGILYLILKYIKKYTTLLDEEGR